MLKPRVIRMALAVDYINEYLMKKGVEFNEIADVCDKLISFEVSEKPIDEVKLSELADEYTEGRWNSDSMIQRQAFKAGYRKAFAK